MGGVNPYGQTDHKIPLFYYFPSECLQNIIVGEYFILDQS